MEIMSRPQEISKSLLDPFVQRVQNRLSLQRIIDRQPLPPAVHTGFNPLSIRHSCNGV